MQIILSVAEHHSNLVPWHMLAARTGAKLHFVPLTKDGTELDMTVCLSLLSSIKKRRLPMAALSCMQWFCHAVASSLLPGSCLRYLLHDVCCRVPVALCLL